MGKLVERTAIVLVSIATVCAVAVFATTFVHAGFYYGNEEEISLPEPTRNTDGSTSTPTKSHSKIIAQLLIPAINVDAGVQSVGLGRSGNMAVPTNFTDVGWYRGGPIPGQVGSAVIDGHVDNGFGMNAVFKHLDELQPGDDIFIEAGGSRKHFVVEDAQIYNADEVPNDLLFNRSDQPRLNLITCAGNWIQDKRSYDERVVVYAVLAP